MWVKPILPYYKNIMHGDFLKNNTYLRDYNDVAYSIVAHCLKTDSQNSKTKDQKSNITEIFF